MCFIKLLNVLHTFLNDVFTVICVPVVSHTTCGEYEYKCKRTWGCFVTQKTHSRYGPARHGTARLERFGMAWLSGAAWRGILEPWTVKSCSDKMFTPEHMLINYSLLPLSVPDKTLKPPHRSSYDECTQTWSPTNLEQSPTSDNFHNYSNLCIDLKVLYFHCYLVELWARWSRYISFNTIKKLNTWLTFRAASLASREGTSSEIGSFNVTLQGTS